ncbi:MDR family MFS transporter [Micromonospora sp. WMMD987]|uniref:MDR family MFS transporter n=1 Tax=Micromonospora sp. WMMD987 TaxID=3016089 RepID=UPI00249A9C2F|nr:MDR family MFS transporter [Micromonospora sp. WMMD987]WFE97550.1 MDR family MFS transporter [Micromonospora sp. WMMD987]
MSTVPESPTAPGQQPVPAKSVMMTVNGLLLGMFVAVLAPTVVTVALPSIVTQLGGSQSAYTWIVTAELLAMTVSVPLWGKLADLYHKKWLLQASLGLFLIGSLVAGAAGSIGVLIVSRVAQGVGAGGLTAMVPVVMAVIVPPRERGKYMGLFGAVFAVGTIVGPPLGGALAEVPGFGWRLCFFFGAPFALLSMIVLQRTFHLPTTRRQVHVDYLGAALIVVAASALLVWCSLAGDVFAWRSGWTVVLVTVGVVALGLTVLVEARSPEPILPLSLFRNRTIVLTTLASMLVGVVLFGASVFVPPYLQLAQGLSPGQTGLLSLPLALGVVVASTVAGHLITSTGQWKAVLVTGAVLTGGGAVMLAMVDENSGLGWFVAAVVVLGLGVGSLMQNLVLVAQSSVDMRQLGVATSTLSFFRSLGGSVGVTVLGAVLAHRVRSVIESRSPQGGGTGDAGGSLPDLGSLPEPVRAVIAQAYAVATGDIFALTVPVAVLILLTVALLRNRPLASQFGMPPGPRRAGDQGPGGPGPGDQGPGGQADRHGTDGQGPDGQGPDGHGPDGHGPGGPGRVPGGAQPVQPGEQSRPSAG